VITLAACSDGANSIVASKFTGPDCGYEAVEFRVMATPTSYYPQVPVQEPSHDRLTAPAKSMVVGELLPATLVSWK